MKKFLFLFMFLCLAMEWGHGQIGQKAFCDTTLWHSHSMFIMVTGSGGNYEEVHMHSYKMVLRDTIINDTLYQGLYTCNQDFSLSSAVFSGYFASFDAQVYFGNSLTDMNIIYDYNLLPGDSFSFKSFNNPQDPNSYTINVNSSDSVLFNGIYRRRIQFDNFPGYNVAPVWVEGVGDFNYGLIFDYGNIVFCSWVGSGNSSLECFNENNLPVIGNCQITSVVTDLHTSKFKLAPNPFQNTIHLEGIAKINGDIRVYNIWGILVFSQRCIHEDFLDLSFLPDGQYVLEYAGEYEIYRQIIIKSKN